MKHRKPEKREPLLADLFLASDVMNEFAHALKPGFLSNVRNALYQAKRFVLDEKATEYIAEVVATAPETIAMAQDFALLPFPVMYIELPDFRKWYRQTNGFDAMTDSDQKVGYLFIGPRAYSLGLTAESNRDWAPGPAKPVVVPIEYRLNEPFRPGERESMAHLMAIEPEALEMVFWGSSYDTVAKTQWADSLIGRHSMDSMLRPEALKTFNRETRMFFAMSNAGDLRNMLAFLLFLNRTSQCTYMNEVPMGRQMIRNKPRTLLSHSVVTIDVAKAPSVRRVFIGVSGGSWKREHDVRGHFCVGKTARESHLCNGLHDWQEYDVNQWKCTQCGGLKWWRKDCRRGTKNKGRVHTTYEVTAKPVHSSARQETA